MKQEPNEEIIKGILYSALTVSGFKPQFWLPNSLTSDEVNKIIDKATAYFSTEEGDIWIDKISILPLPFQKYLGMTYFYKEPTDTLGETLTASITLLVNANMSNFFYRNIERLKRDLEMLAGELNKKYNQKSILSQYYSNLLEFVDRYQGYRQLSGIKEKIEDIIKGCVLLTYFNSKLGPRPFYCYPEDFLSEKQQIRLSRELEYSQQEGLFVKTYSDFVAIHLYFELKSELARGHIEMCLVSLIFEELPSKDMIDNISFRLLDLIDKLYLTPDVSIGFYEVQYGIKKDVDKIRKMSDYMQNWVRETYRTCIEEYFTKSSEGEFSAILIDLNRVRVLEKLSDGPIELKKLENWAKTNLDKELDMMGLISPLIDSNLATIEEISGQAHVILLKGLRVYRISPINTLEKLKSFGSIYPEIYPDLFKQYSRETNQFFRRYKTSRNEIILLSQIIYDPINYLIITKLRRGGIYLKDDFREVLGENIYNRASHNIEFLKKHHIITEIMANNEVFILLKTDIKFVKTLPKYILLERKQRNILPDPLKEVGDRISKTPNQIKDMFKRWFS